MSEKSKGNNTKKKERFYLLDDLRGFAVLGMIFCHTLYDLESYGVILPFTYTWQYELWEQFLRFLFFFISGYCVYLGRKSLKRGLIVSACGLIVTIVSIVIKVNPPIVFGVLTCMGFNMIAAIPFKRIINKKNAPYFLFGFLILLVLTLHIHRGYFGILSYKVFEFPKAWYGEYSLPLTYVLAFLGIPSRKFASSDYFPFVPWFFLFMTGFSVNAWLGDKLSKMKIMKLKVQPLEFIGKHSLIFYLAHQPIVMGIVMLLDYTVGLG
ncbi:MAG: DUF1624 domain-containing protein [Lachnospiraceae bacterium]|nr:DUF1624 domain-containing protein [Lachnospiraceae bacterium]